MTKAEILRLRSEREFDKFKFLFSIGVLLTGGLSGMVIKGVEGSLIWVFASGVLINVAIYLISGKAYIESERFLKKIEEEAEGD